MKRNRKNNTPECRNLEARFANICAIGFNRNEFIFDFGQVYEEKGDERFHTRIVMTPACAGKVLKVLEVSVGEYGETFGVVLDA